MKQLFLDISEKIEAVPAIRWVDFDLGQLEQELPPVSYPCALISVQSGEFTNLTSLAQHGELIIAVRVAFKVFERTHSKTENNFREVGLQHLDTLQAVHYALHGMDGENFDSLQRQSMATEPNLQNPNLRIYTLLYTTLYNDSDDNPNEAIYTPFNTELKPILNLQDGQ